jgi:hypothetical protein
MGLEGAESIAAEADPQDELAATELRSTHRFECGVTHQMRHTG